jgi:glyoxylase-like metal-dependent hydrolase (beta-lactamase superfamily II)
MAIVIQHFFHQPSFTYSYVIADNQSKQAAVIDPVLDFDLASGTTDSHSVDQIIGHLRSAGLELRWILETHAHADHLSGAKVIQDALGGKIAIGANIPEVQGVFKSIFNLDKEFVADGSQFDQLFSEGEQIPLGESAFTVLATPGHTPACVSYLIDDALFCGDTLFMPDYGTARCDFPGGDAGVLYDSIQQIFSLPTATRIFMCHDYGPNGRDYQFQTSVAEQRDQNIHVGGGKSRDEFVARRSERDATLGMPALMLPAVQINIRAGGMPPPEENGTAYLKLPLNLL